MVALKLLPKYLSQDDVFQQRFRREAHAAAKLANPHVIPIHFYGEIDGQLFVDMRLIEGRDLQAVLSDGPMEPRRAVRIVEQVARALHAAHKAGLVHRDVKPSNILVDEDDYAYLIDFGIARAAGETGLTGTSGVIGSWQYMAPERFTTKDADARVDVYALACVLYECLTGELLYPGDSLEQLYAGHVATPPPRPSLTNPGLSVGFDRVTEKGLAKDPNQRFATTIELADAARDATAAPTPRPAPTGAGPTVYATPPTMPRRVDTPTPRVSTAAPTWQPVAAAPPTWRGEPPRRPGRRTVAIDKRSGQAVGAGRRFAAALIDVIAVPIVFFAIGEGIWFAASRTRCQDFGGVSYCSRQMPPGWNGAPAIIALVAVIAYCLWNWGYRKGGKGSTIANSVLRYKVVRADTGEPIGLSGKRIALVVVCTLVGPALGYIVLRLYRWLLT